MRSIIAGGWIDMPILRLVLCSTMIVSVALPAASQLASTGRTQKVKVSAPWPTSCLSPLAEAAEFIADDTKADMLWKYVESLGNAPHWVFSCSSDEAPVGEPQTSTSSALGSGLTDGDFSGEFSHSDASVTHAIMAAGQGFGEEKAGMELDDMSLRLMELALSARSHAPAIEAHRTLAAASAGVCGDDPLGDASPETATPRAAPSAWAVVLPHGAVVCSPADLPGALSGTCSLARGGEDEEHGALEDRACQYRFATDRVSGFDHVYPFGESGSVDPGYDEHDGDLDGDGDSIPTTTAILYGVVGSPSMMGFHEVLKAAAERGELRYVFRHALPHSEGNTDDGGSSVTSLQGYGVVLDVKNMEYRNYDSSATTAESGGGDASEGKVQDELSLVEGEELNGVVLSAILARRPELQRELGILRQALLLQGTGGGAGSGIEEESGGELKVWNMGDLGLQALQSIAAAEHPLLRLEELSQNFPSHASALSALKVQPGTREEAKAAERYLVDELGLRQGRLYVNGRAMELEGPTFNAFQILRVLREESNSLRGLEHVGAPLDALAGEGGRSLLKAAGPLVHSGSGASGAGSQRSALFGGAKTQAWRVDLLGRDEEARHGGIVWLNNIEFMSRAAREACHAWAGWSCGLRLLTSLGCLRVEGDEGAIHVVTSEGKVVVKRSSRTQEDPRYSRWSSDLHQLMLAMYQVPQIRRNLCNLVMLVDPATASGAEVMQMAAAIVDQGIPARVGLILVAEDDVASVDDDGWGKVAGGAEAPETDFPEAREIAELIWRLSQHAGRSAVKSFVSAVGKAISDSGNVPNFNRTHLRRLFVQAAGPGPLSDSKAASQPWTEGGAVWGASEEEGPLPGARAMARFAGDKGLSVPSWSMNGIVKDGLGDLRGSLLQVVMQEHLMISQLAGSGLVSSKTKDIYARVLKHCGAKVYERFHPALVESPGDAWVVDLSSPRAVELMEGRGRRAEQSPRRLPAMRWVHPAGTSDSPKGVSMVVAVDHLSAEGLRTLEQALMFIVTGASPGQEAGEGEDDQGLLLPSSGLRLAVVFNPASDGGEAQGGTGAAALPGVFRALGERSPDKVPKFLLALVRQLATHPTSTDGQVVVALAQESGLSPALCAAVESAWKEGVVDDESVRAVRLARELMGVDPGETCALVNGRRAPSTTTGRPLMASDLSLLAEIADPLGALLMEEASAWDWGAWPEGSPESADPDLVNAQLQSDVIAKLTSFLIVYHQEARRLIPGADTISTEVASSTVRRKSKHRKGAGVRRSGSGDDPSETASQEALCVLRLGGDGRLAGRRDVEGAPEREAGKDGAGIGDPEDSLQDVSDGEGADALPGAGGVRDRDGDGPEKDQEEGAEAHREMNLEVVAVLDPLSLASQRASTLLHVVQDVLGLPVTLLVVPSLEITELPLKNFYRLVLGPASGSMASFERLPTREILTQRLDTPEPWNVQALTALQDIDNLRCDSGGCGDNGTYVTSTGYTLKGLLLMGRCYDIEPDGPPSPPQGLQLVLRGPEAKRSPGSEERTVLADTVVMNNLGYFQLQAAPGVWEVALAPGRASEVYDIISSAGEGGSGGSSSPGSVDRVVLTAMNNYEKMPAVEAQVVTVRDFYSRYLPVVVRKRAGMESVGLLEEGPGGGDPKLSHGRTGQGSLVNSVLSMLGYAGSEAGAGSGAKVDGSAESDGRDGGPEERVHVFSLATGHLYERLMKVMMLSVVKRCSVPVTFWLLENFLSPALKESAQLLAEEYGFRVEFVTYKWPEWLRRQSEKQRTIWGYKILFLDVLFPLDVDKVIYVDADQVVRADLKELWDLDLEGAPYAYTPFCSSREETLGYQFWRGGFWQNHLSGRPYHISALYVVDLKTFRRKAVGDVLRATYNALSADPNSLANLDQDLPNYTQIDVPIFSLPQEWLWCETWCSDESKARAKTIDLCNNPQHKEPKLDMAKRVISGQLFEESWVELDAEARAVETRRRHDEQQLSL